MRNSISGYSRLIAELTGVQRCQPHDGPVGVIGQHGWYALSRGIATLVSSIEKDPLAAKGLLRHSSGATTLEHYIKEVPEITKKALLKVEALCNHRATGLAAPTS